VAFLRGNLDCGCISVSDKGLPCAVKLCEGTDVRIPADVRAAMAEVSRKFGSQGGKTAAQNMNMTAEERSTRAKKASDAAEKKRTEKRLAAKGPRSATGTRKRLIDS
jgi:hypothetical protein